MRYSYIYIIMCISLLFSCSSDKKEGKKTLVKAQSAPYELLVVADKDWLKTEAGQALVAFVEQPIPGLPQAEPNFRPTYIYPKDFQGTFRAYSNVLVVEVGIKHQKSEMTLDRDVFARPQVIIGLYAPSDQALMSLIEVRQKEILAQFNEQEFSRERKLLAKTYSAPVLEQAKKQFGITIHVPKDITDMKIAPNFLWAAATERDFRQNLCLYTFPLTDLKSLDANSDFRSLESIRDSMLKVNIPGGREDQWMETDYRTVVYDDITNPNRMVMRGLWDMRNDAMGGPFVSYIYVDTARQRCLVAETFIFAPDKKKRPLVRQMEAALQTVTFEQNQEPRK